jgi:osmotically inducible protein OsmC
MKRHATAVWHGNLADGKDSIDTQSGALNDHGYSFKARFEDESGKAGTSPEELLAAAHAGCFAMQLSHFLAENGTPAEVLEAESVITVEQVEGGFEIKSSALLLTGKVPGIRQDKFEKLADKAKRTCPMTKALEAIDITLEIQVR